MSSSCMGKELPKEKKWGIKNCRERKCPELRKNGNTDYPDDEQERCQVFGTLPGTLPCCIKDLDNLPPRDFLHTADWHLLTEEEQKIRNKKVPGQKNCPATCPYKISEIGDKWVKMQKKKGTIWKCAFTGDELGHGMSSRCSCHIIDSSEPEMQITLLQSVIIRRRAEKIPFQPMRCTGDHCPDGAQRCKGSDCPLIRVPLVDMKECPLWRIPAKLLQVPAIEATPKPTPEPDQNTEKPESPAERLARGKAIREEALENRETMKRMSTRKSSLKEKPAEPEKKTRKKKEPEDLICKACSERNHGHVPDHACEGCKEEQEKKGRRAWTTELSLQTVHLGDMEKLGEQIPDESIDVIFTDPVYLKEQYENAYARLAELACRVLKPNGFLFTYAPQTHLDEIMDLLRYSNVTSKEQILHYFWVIESLNEGARTAKNHQRNAICLHKPILVFQKSEDGENLKGARHCFNDVIRGLRQKKFHPWQQSVHDVLGIISRFMVPGEILLDPYAGTGTSLIAANLLGMEWLGFEIDPKTHAIAVRELQQQPIALEAFGVEAEAAECEREPAEIQKDTSKQASIDTPEKITKKRSRIDKPDSGIKTEPSDPAKGTRPVELVAPCLSCEAVARCMRHDPRAGCLDKFLDFEKTVEDAREEEKQWPDRGSCNNCQHSAINVIMDSCPRLEKGIYAYTLYDETEVNPCKFWGEREGPGGNWLVGKKPALARFDGPYDPDGKVKKKPRDHGTGGGPQPYVQHCCGTCGHHKGRKTFHESCPRLGELQFKKGTKSAKVLMDETARDPCEHWKDKEPEPPAKPKKDTPEWFAALTEVKRRNNPGWLWEVWKTDPSKDRYWLYEGAATEQEACELRDKFAADPERLKFGPGIIFDVRKRPAPDYDEKSIEGPCRTCNIECLDDNNGCQEFEDHSRKLDGEPIEETEGFPVCIISCGKAKVWDKPGMKGPKKFSACDAYTGPLFTSAKNYAEKRHRGPWYILSDKYGLILPGEEIENYDVSPEDIKDDPDFFETVHHRARSDPDLSRTKKIVLIAGKIHQDIIERAFPGVEIENPVQGLTQGERMKVLRELVSVKSASKKSKKPKEETES